MKILAFDISGTYSSIALLNGNEVNAFTQTHERKHRPEWDELFSRINFDSLKFPCQWVEITRTSCPR